MTKNDVKNDAIDETKIANASENTEISETTPITEPKFSKGVVSNCVKLNIRKAPDKTAPVIGVVNVGAELKINIFESSDSWYKVTTKNKKNGYCMVDFVTLNN